mgnify:FL=1
MWDMNQQEDNRSVLNSGMVVEGLESGLENKAVLTLDTRHDSRGSTKLVLNATTYPYATCEQKRWLGSNFPFWM